MDRNWCRVFCLLERWTCILLAGSWIMNEAGAHHKQCCHFEGTFVSNSCPVVLFRQMQHRGGGKCVTCVLIVSENLRAVPAGTTTEQQIQENPLNLNQISNLWACECAGEGMIRYFESQKKSFSGAVEEKLHHVPASTAFIELRFSYHGWLWQGDGTSKLSGAQSRVHMEANWCTDGSRKRRCLDGCI